MSIRIAVAGVRHFHILSLIAAAREMPGVEIAAVCEEDPEARRLLREQGKVEVTHEDFSAMLSEVPCEAVALGDYYGKRGELAIGALRAGRHVISDKPLCTSAGELEIIERLAETGNLRVGCMLTQRYSAVSREARRLVLGGVLGDVQAIAFGGQHPLSRGSRPGWYFEPGRHGGTINDIAIHMTDFLPWATGLEFATVNAARTWNAFVPEHPHFHDAGQLMLTMDNGCGVLGDVSYFSPDSQGYSLPFYWRTTFFGRKGILEKSSKSPVIALALDGEKGIREHEPTEPGRPAGYLEDFIADIRGEPEPGSLDTATVIRASRLALLLQEAADGNAREVSLPGRS